MERERRRERERERGRKITERERPNKKGSAREKENKSDHKDRIGCRGVGGREKRGERDEGLGIERILKTGG